MSSDNTPLMVERNERGFWVNSEHIDRNKSVLGMSYVLGEGTPGTVHTGTTAITLINPIVVPGGLLGANGSLRYTAIVSAVVSANAKPMGFSYAGNNNISSTFFAANATIARISAEWFVKNGTVIAPPLFLGPHQAAASVMVSGAADIEVDQPAGLVVQLLSAADQITLEAWRLEVFPS